MRLIDIILLVVFFAMMVAFGLTVTILQKRVKRSEKMTESVYADYAKSKTERDFYFEENLRLVGANQKLAEIVFSKRGYVKTLDGALEAICVLCDADKTIPPDCTMPYACMKCQWKDTKARYVDSQKGE